jgi:Tfp pilus assembly protein PilX
VNIAMQRIAPRREEGVVLFIALIALVAMTLAGIAMMRSTDTTVGIAGNLAFKQSTVQGGEQAPNAAVNWLQGVNAAGTLQQNYASQGYTAYVAGSEPNWFDQSVWSLPNTPNDQPSRSVTLATDAAGNTVRYMIHRMCSGPGNYGSVQCATYLPSSGGGAGSSMAVGSVTFVGTTQVYFRITTRVEGPRNTVSITQAYVLLDGT